MPGLCLGPDVHVGDAPRVVSLLQFRGKLAMIVTVTIEVDSAKSSARVTQHKDGRLVEDMRLDASLAALLVRAITSAFRGFRGAPRGA